MYRSRAKVDPYGTDCGVSSVSALHALFLWATRRARRVAFFRAAWKLHHWKNESDGLNCPKLKEAREVRMIR
jgi:hypothetical protein